MKHFWTLIVVSAILLLAVMASATTDQRLVIGAAERINDNLIRIPISISNTDNFVGIDVTLKYSAGLKFKEIDYTNTRISYFEWKQTMLRETDNTVVFMGLPYCFGPKQDPLSEGSGKVADLVFEVTDPSITEVSLEPAETVNPYHSIFFVYQGKDEQGNVTIYKEFPKIENNSAPVSGGGSISEPSNVPKEYGLDQNYPNPFNPDTEIKYSLPKNSHVELTVYNVLGQAVKTLVNQDMAAGSYQVTWDGKNSDGQQVSSGIYFYRLAAGSYGATKKMMMLK